MGLPFLLCRAFVQSAASEFERNEIPQWSFVNSAGKHLFLRRIERLRDGLLDR